MKTIIVTGSGGVVGYETCRHFLERGFRVVGVDNDGRRNLFGPEASTCENINRLADEYEYYDHWAVDIRNQPVMEQIIAGYRVGLHGVIHAAGQPSHDWSATFPMTDFELNATATLRLLELMRQYACTVPFLFCSTNKVYGDRVNGYQYLERATRYELPDYNPYWGGVDESMDVDYSLHSPFGVSKLAADMYVQEYGRYYEMPTATFRCGCLTGGAHRGVKLHGFLSYLVRCLYTGTTYTIIGHKGKQVRDNLHTADLAAAFGEYIDNPAACGVVYNMGGGRTNSCSVREAIQRLVELTGKALPTGYSPEARIGDHKWWITSTTRFEQHYPGWQRKWSLDDIFAELISAWEEQ